MYKYVENFVFLLKKFSPPSYIGKPLKTQTLKFHTVPLFLESVSQGNFVF